MTLTGLESPRDKLMLHYLVVNGAIDDRIAQVKWNRIARPTMLALRQMGHPIRFEPSPKGHYRYLWGPSL